MLTICGDLQPIFAKQRPGMPETQANIWQFFLDNVRDNLHVVLCFSPMNPKYPIRAQKFPGLFNCPTIDFFLPWPQGTRLSAIVASTAHPPKFMLLPLSRQTRW